jgi:hypothetical protein
MIARPLCAFALALALAPRPEAPPIRVPERGLAYHWSWVKQGAVLFRRLAEIPLRCCREPAPKEFKPTALAPPPGSRRRTLVIRSGQPGAAHLEQLAELIKQAGIDPGRVAVVNLRLENNREARMVQEEQARPAGERRAFAGFRTVHVPMLDSFVPTMGQVARVLDTVLNSSFDAVAIHCTQGIGRTGVMIACIRIALDGWSVERALDEANAFGLERPLQRWFVRRFARQWRAGKIHLSNLDNGRTHA